MSHQQGTLDAGFEIVVDVDRVIHRTEGPCFKEGGQYIPFAHLAEAEAHGNIPCSRCFGGGSVERESASPGEHET